MAALAHFLACTNVYKTLPFSKVEEKKRETYIHPEESSCLGNASTDCWILGKNKLPVVKKQQLKCHHCNVVFSDWFHAELVFFFCLNADLPFLSFPSLLVISYMVRRKFRQEALSLVLVESQGEEHTIKSTAPFTH